MKRKRLHFSVYIFGVTVRGSKSVNSSEVSSSALKLRSYQCMKCKIHQPPWSVTIPFVHIYTNWDKVPSSFLPSAEIPLPVDLLPSPGEYVQWYPLHPRALQTLITVQRSRSLNAGRGFPVHNSHYITSFENETRTLFIWASCLN